MTRRKFLYFSSILLFIPVTNFTWKYFESRPLLYPETLCNLCDPIEIEKIGKKYLSKTPAERTKQRLAQLLLTDARGNDYSEANKIEIKKMIKQKIKDDFASFHTVTIDGWIISITEARQCALLSKNLN